MVLLFLRTLELVELIICRRHICAPARYTYQIGVHRMQLTEEPTPTSIEKSSLKPQRSEAYLSTSVSLFNKSMCYGLRQPKSSHNSQVENTIQQGLSGPEAPITYAANLYCLLLTRGLHKERETDANFKGRRKMEFTLRIRRRDLSPSFIIVTKEALLE